MTCRCFRNSVLSKICLREMLKMPGHICLGLGITWREQVATADDRLCRRKVKCSHRINLKLMIMANQLTIFMVCLFRKGKTSCGTSNSFTFDFYDFFFSSFDCEFRGYCERRKETPTLGEYLFRRTRNHKSSLILKNRMP